MEIINFLKDLEYSKSNYEGVGVHYGDHRAISINPKKSAYLTPGNIILFCKKPSQIYVKHDLTFDEPAEIINQTSHRVFVKLIDSMLSHKKVGDLTYYVNPGVEK